MGAGARRNRVFARCEGPNSSALELIGNLQFQKFFRSASEFSANPGHPLYHMVSSLADHSTLHVDSSIDFNAYTCKPYTRISSPSSPACSYPETATVMAPASSISLNLTC